MGKCCKQTFETNIEKQILMFKIDLIQNINKKNNY